MNPSSLAQPVGSLAVPTHHLDAEDSVGLAARRIRENGAPILPVVREGRLIGIVSEASLAQALADGVEPDAPALDALDIRQFPVAPYVTGAEALRRFHEGDVTALVVADDTGRVIGIVRPSDLYPRPNTPPRPPLVGGMATPFGVYLTTGAVRAGASDLALVTTGMVLALLLLASAAGADALALGLASSGLADGWIDSIASGAAIVFFLVLMRALPLSGTHAAEHKVVHAIERSEELRPEIVRRMPRVHPRCGTNIAVGATLFLGLATWRWVDADEIRLLVAALVTLMLWRRLGAYVQAYITTKRPSDRQLQNGIETGKELLERHARAHRHMPSFGRRLYLSGMFHVMVGSSIVLVAAEMVARWFGLPIPGTAP